MIYLLYILFTVFGILTIVMLWIGIESLLGGFFNIAPAVSAGYRKRAAVLSWIHDNYSNAKTMVDIGSGYGAMARSVAKDFPKAKVVGIEVMPLPYLYSVFRCFFEQNVVFKFGNAFKFLSLPGQKFDIGITYLLGSEMAEVEKFRSNFHVLLVVDFPLPNIRPSQKLKIYHDGINQHWLYVYK